MDMLRLFIAIELPQHILTRLDNLQFRIKQDVPSGLVRWVRPEGIHLTLQFLGDVPSEQAAAIVASLRRVGPRFAPFEFEVGGLGCFPNSRRPNVIWVGVQENSGELSRLQGEIEQAMTPLGFRPEGRSFTPHLTLGRIKGGRPEELQVLGDYITRSKARVGPARAEAVSLMRSELLPGGAVYTCLERTLLTHPMP